jgi:hypothetical protein
MMFSGTVNKTPSTPAENKPDRQHDNNSESKSCAQPKAEREKRFRPTSTGAEPGSGSSSSTHSSPSSRSSHSSHKKKDDFEDSRTKPNAGATLKSTSSKHTRKTRPTTTQRVGVNFHIEQQTTVIPEPVAEPATAEPATTESTMPTQETNYLNTSNNLPDLQNLDNDYLTMQHKSKIQQKFYMIEKERHYEYEIAKSLMDSYHRTMLSAINLDSNNNNNYMENVTSIFNQSRNLYMAQKRKEADESLARALKEKGESSTSKN